MKIVDFDDEDAGKQHAGRDEKVSERKIKIVEFGKGKVDTTHDGSPAVSVGKIKIRQYGDEPSRRENPVRQTAAVKPPAVIKIIEFDKEMSAKVPAVTRHSKFKIIESN